MEEFQQCPVCTLFLHNGISMEDHLDTHPKDQVIKALCQNITKKSPSAYGSRASTPRVRPDYNYKSDSENTQATLNDTVNFLKNNRPVSVILSQNSNAEHPCEAKYDEPGCFKSKRNDNQYNQVPNTSIQLINSQYSNYETRYKSNQYLDNTVECEIEGLFEPNTSASYKEPTINIVKTNRQNNFAVLNAVDTVQYVTPDMKPLHIFMPNVKTFVNTQSNKSNLIVTSIANNTSVIQGKIPITPVYPAQYVQENNVGIVPTTSATTSQNQFTFREIFDGKQFITTIDGEQYNSSYQTAATQSQTEEYCGLPPLQQLNTSTSFNQSYENNIDSPRHTTTSNTLEKNETTVALTKKGLKILSNIKVEVPLQHHKSMVNEIVDLTSIKDDAGDKQSPTVNNTPSVIKNVTKKILHMKEKPESIKTNSDNVIPDLSCNEKPYTSPTVELENNTHAEMTQEEQQHNNSNVNVKRVLKNHPLKLNNIFVKKHKKTSNRQTNVQNVIDMVIREARTRTEPIPEVEETVRQNNIRCVPSSMLQQNKSEEQPEIINFTLTDQNTVTKVEIIPDESDSLIDYDTSTNVDNNEFIQLENARPNTSYADLINENFEKSYRDEGDNKRNIIDLVNENYFNSGMYGHFIAEEGSDGIIDTTKNVVSKSEINDEDGCTWALPQPELNICADERMPPHGELSGQESNSGMDTPWNMYQDFGMGNSCDLIAKETWYSDGSDNEATNDQYDPEKVIVQLAPQPIKSFKCSTCGEAFNCPKERRVHRAKIHAGVSKKVALPTNQKKIIKTERREEEVVINDANTEIPALDLVLDQKPKLELPVIMVRRGVQRCDVCFQTFTKTDYNQHLQDVHPLECLVCGKYFYKRFNLRLHMKIHLNMKKHKCELCGKAFLTKQKLGEHRNMHTGNTPIKCTMCDETFKRYSAMIFHRNRYHFNKKPKIKDYVCHCGEVVHTLKKLIWHKELHSDKPKVCSHCGDKFIHVSSLTRHIRRNHNAYYLTDERGASKNTCCPMCQKVVLRCNLEVHLRTHTGKRPFSCVICERRFTTKWNLKLHKWTHMSRSSKPFQCPQCSSTFIRKLELQQHLNSHKSIKPYTCNHCGRKFLRKYNCQRHVKEHTTEKKFKCTVADCDKTFHRRYYLTEHMRVHSGARPYSCTICGKTSASKSNHNKHLKVHHARDPIPAET